MLLGAVPSLANGTEPSNKHHLLCCLYRTEQTRITSRWVTRILCEMCDQTWLRGGLCLYVKCCYLRFWFFSNDVSLLSTMMECGGEIAAWVGYWVSRSGQRCRQNCVKDALDGRRGLLGVRLMAGRLCNSLWIPCFWSLVLLSNGLIWAAGQSDVRGRRMAGWLSDSVTQCFV